MLRSLERCAFCELGRCAVYKKLKPRRINRCGLLYCHRLTQSDLSKGDRTRVMVCITMDAHGRDVVQKMAREGVSRVSITFVCCEIYQSLGNRSRQQLTCGAAAA